MPDVLIECLDVTHTYQRGTPMEAPALRGVTMQVRAHEILGILGPTGSGKSTLVQHFNGLLRPTSGRVLLAGQDLWASGFDRRQARQQVGLVFQFPEYQIFEETVRRDVAYGPQNLGLPEEEVRARVDGALRLVGLDPDRFGDRPPFSLSGGEMRRVALAGVLAMRPRVLVLDEPTAGLDPRARRELFDRVQTWHRQGTTVIVVTHSMDEIARLASRIVVMHHGTITMDASPREIFAREGDLRAVGLALPQPALLMRALRRRGIPVEEALTLQEARRVIVRAMRDRDPH